MEDLIKGYRAGSLEIFRASGLGFGVWVQGTRPGAPDRNPANYPK